MTYEELDRASSAVADTLRSQGVACGGTVAIWMRKSIETVVAIYATLKCAAAYVPIDPSAPPHRARRIIDDCAPSCVITNSDFLDSLARTGDAGNFPFRVISVGDRAEPPAVAATDWADALLGDASRGSAAGRDRQAAYVLYTSGSTGVPKGATLSHRNALAFVRWAVDEFGLQPSDRISSHAPFTFDLSIFDIFATSLAGGCACLIPESQVGLGFALNAFVVGRGITVWYSVPKALTEMVGAENSPVLTDSRLRVVLFAGEVFPPKHLRRLRALLPTSDLYNLYGPTETNVCTFHFVRDSDLGPQNDEPVPIGRPCTYAETFLLNEQGTVLEHRSGEMGELCVAGESVMLGYWGDEKLSEAKMVTIHREEASPVKAYRTGDLVRIDSDLNYVFCGREDDMVKLRGYRVELGEIESAISRADIVNEVACVVVSDTSGDKRLEAFVVPRETPCDLGLVRRTAAVVLPRYMIPDVFHVVRALPRTATGKVDRRALVGAGRSD